MKENASKEKLFWKMENESGCPVCSLLMDYEFNLLANIQYDITNDDSLRKQIAMGGGFCDFHFRQFKKIANGKTNIVFLKTIIEVGPYKKENFKINCKICEKVHEYEIAAVQIFTNLLSTVETAAKFEQSNGICFDHLKMANNFIKDVALRTWLGRTHIYQIERMKEDFVYMNGISSFYEIDREKRGLINALIQKLTGRKSGGL